VGQRQDCYTDGGDEEELMEKHWEPAGWKVYPTEAGTLKKFERPYSPFITGEGAADYTMPSYLLPARILYMAIGTARGGGVTPEEHPSAWFAAVKGRKRWLLHPPNQQGPREPMFVRNDSCRPKSLYTVTRVCDQQEGDILWLPGGWWHETCNLDSYSAGIGGVTYDGADRPRKDRGKCNLGHDEHFSRLLSQRTGSPHAVDDIPYCTSSEAGCGVLPWRRDWRDWLPWLPWFLAL